MKRKAAKSKARKRAEMRGAVSARGGASNAPLATRPHFPGYGIPPASGGKGLLPWSWAEQRLARAHNYWLATVRDDGRPHVMPIWGVWFERRFLFSTGEKSRKARNLARDSRCVVCPENARQAIVLEGVAEPVRDANLIAAAGRDYFRKYKWKLDPKLGPIFAVRPLTVFALNEADKIFGETATRWRFSA